MGLPSPAIIVGGARCSLRAFRRPKPFRATTTTMIFDSKASSHYAATKYISSVGNMLQRELKLLEHLPGSSRTFATVHPNSYFEVNEPQELTNTEKTKHNQPLPEAISAEYNRWTAYNAGDPASSKAVFNRSSPLSNETFGETERYYREVKEYTAQ